MTRASSDAAIRQRRRRTAAVPVDQLLARSLCDRRTQTVLITGDGSILDLSATKITALKLCDESALSYGSSWRTDQVGCVVFKAALGSD
jgi:hypothetical protein